MLTAAAALLVFDGRDLADAITADDEVIGYALVTCRVCGTERDRRYPYCCEFAAVDAAERTLVTCEPPPSTRRGPSSAGAGLQRGRVA